MWLGSFFYLVQYTHARKRVPHILLFLTRANTHFYVMITQFVLLIYCIFSLVTLVHSYDIQNIFSVAFEISLGY